VLARRHHRQPPRSSGNEPLAAPHRHASARRTTGRADGQLDHESAGPARQVSTRRGSRLAAEQLERGASACEPHAAARMGAAASANSTVPSAVSGVGPRQFRRANEPTRKDHGSESLAQAPQHRAAILRSRFLCWMPTAFAV
jgi:hypothetical protein